MKVQVLKYLVSILTLALSACAPMVWVKPGATQNDFSKDKYSCTLQAQQRVSSAKINASGGASNSEVITNSNLYTSCMNSIGWYLKNQQDGQRQVQSQQSQQANVKQQQSQKIQQAKVDIKKALQDRKDSCEKEEYRALLAKSACQSNELTLEQLSDSTKISQIEKPVFMAWFAESRSTGRKIATAYRSSGDPVGLELANLAERTDRRLETKSLELYEGKITWGEYNKGRKEIGSSSHDEAQTIMKKK